MTQKAVPMIRVPDVLSTIAWYQRIGFTLKRVFEDEGETNWALLSFGTSELMFNAGGLPNRESGRDVDLYAQVEDVDALYKQLKDRVDVEAAPYNAFHGMREFVIRDPNGFSVIFGEPIASHEF
jgi:uncharacterized glyoxalase superfamily protein PhnB